jgi:hypothetical protein
LPIRPAAERVSFFVHRRAFRSRHLDVGSPRALSSASLTPLGLAAPFPLPLHSSPLPAAEDLDDDSLELVKTICQEVFDSPPASGLL